MNSIQIADNQNGVLFDSSKWQDKIIVNNCIEVIKLEDENIQLRIKTLDTKSKTGFAAGVFPDVKIKAIENKYWVTKKMWNKFLSNWLAAEFNYMYEQLSYTKLWYKNDEKESKDCYEFKVIAFNAAFTIVSSKIINNEKK